MITVGQNINTRKEISKILGGDVVKGITVSSQYNVILLFANDRGTYKDHFYEKNNEKYCLYTGIGKAGHQDSPQNNMYNLNLAVLNHQDSNLDLLLFRKHGKGYRFEGVFQLLETYQNVQVDFNNDLRRVFMFHLTKIEDIFLL